MGRFSDGVACVFDTLYDVFCNNSTFGKEELFDTDCIQGIRKTPRMNSIIALGDVAVEERSSFYQYNIANDIYNLCDDAEPEEVNVALMQLSRIISACDSSYYSSLIAGFIKKLGRR